MTRHPLAWPLAIAALSGAGLIAGLVGDGLWDLLAWAGLGVPLIPVALALRRKPAKGR